MVNKLKKFFRVGGKSSSTVGEKGNGNGNGHGTSPLMQLGIVPHHAESSNNQQHHQSILHDMLQSMSGSKGNNSSSSPRLSGATVGHDNNSNDLIEMMLTSPPKDMNASGKFDPKSAAKWSLVLSKIPKLASEIMATDPIRDDNGARLVVSLLDLLTQMASRDVRTQINAYCSAQHWFDPMSNGSSSIAQIASASAAATLEQRRVVKSCRRAFLMLWKFVLPQLSAERTQGSPAALLTDELREMYQQIVCLIIERVEFNLPEATSTFHGGGGLPDATTASTAFVSAASAHSRVPSPGKAVAASNATGSAQENMDMTSDDAVEFEKDLYLYRCLLVATFKSVTENVEGAKQQSRPRITMLETIYFARILMLAYMRVPVVQRIILSAVYEAHATKKWLPSHQKPTAFSPKVNPTPYHHRGRRRSSKGWIGPTFTQSLARWSDFDGKSLVEMDDTPSSKGDTIGQIPRSDSVESSSSVDSTSTFHFSSNKTATQLFKRLNPTFFRWKRYSPYLSSYADADVFRLDKHAWLEKLTGDGEFFSIFFGLLCSYVENTAITTTTNSSTSTMASTASNAATDNRTGIVWRALPGYALLVRVSLLLVKEAVWKQWMDLQTYSDPTAGLNPLESFDLTKRGVKSVLTNSNLLLENGDLLESCVLALLESTNAYEPRSVGLCLSQLEVWITCCAVDTTTNNNKSSSSSSNPLEGGARLPVTFSGSALSLALRIMLCSESFEILNRVLLFLYYRLDYFDRDLRQGVLKALVQRHMFLFLHWNEDVRDNYHHLLVYKIARVDRYALHSFLDCLLLGICALPLNDDDNDDDFDDNQSNSMQITGNGNGTILGTRYSKRKPQNVPDRVVLAVEQALWRAFDACIGAIIAREREYARESNRKFQIEMQGAKSRSIAFQKLNRQLEKEDDPLGGIGGGLASMNEGLPGGKACHEVELLDEELRREPPNYLRYLPVEEVAVLEDLRRLSSTVKHPSATQVYAATSLRNYTDVLRKYYNQMSEKGYVDVPPLGFC